MSESESSSVEDNSSIHSEELWVNSRSVTEESEASEETATSDEDSESDEQPRVIKTVEIVSQPLATIKEEENDVEPNVDEVILRKEIFNNPEADTDPARELNLPYLYKLMQLEVPEEVLEHQMSKEKEKENQIEICSRCETQELCPSKTVQFLPCKHKYCINCVLNSYGENENTLFYQCPVVSCTSTYATAKIESNFPKEFSSFKNFIKMRELNQQHVIVTSLENEGEVKKSKKEKKKEKKEKKLSLKLSKKKNVKEHANAGEIKFEESESEKSTQEPSDSRSKNHSTNEHDEIKSMEELENKSSEVIPEIIGKKESSEPVPILRKSLSRESSKENENEENIPDEHSSSKTSKLEGSEDIKVRKRRFSFGKKRFSEKQRLQNVLSVGCPRCKEAVSADPGEDIVICSGCEHGFCFACLQPMDPNSTEQHRCVSSTDLLGDESEPPSQTKKRRRRSLTTLFRAILPGVLRQALANRRPQNSEEYP